MEPKSNYCIAACPASRASGRRGFSFTEILFAVMILGIGFIMVAAIFPVAIQQTDLTGQETVASNIAREATDAMTSINNSAYLPPTVSNPPTINPPTANQRVIGQVWGLHDDRMVNWTGSAPPAGTFQRDFTWNAISGNLILPMDRRYAWVGMYKRDGTWNSTATGITPDPYAQVILIGVQCRSSNTDHYDPTIDLDRDPNISPPPPATLEPTLLTAAIRASNTANVPIIEFDRSAGDNRENRLGPGAFVIVSDDNMNTYSNPTFAAYAGQFNGHVFRLGNFRPDLSTTDLATYEMAPGYDAFPDPGINPGLVEIPKAQVLVVGRPYAKATDPKNGNSTLTFDGPVQDIAVYVTYIRVN